MSQLSCILIIDHDTEYGVTLSDNLRQEIAKPENSQKWGYFAIDCRNSFMDSIGILNDNSTPVEIAVVAISDNITHTKQIISTLRGRNIFVILMHENPGEHVETFGCDKITILSKPVDVTKLLANLVLIFPMELY